MIILNARYVCVVCLSFYSFSAHALSWCETIGRIKGQIKHDVQSDRSILASGKEGEHFPSVDTGKDLIMSGIKDPIGFRALESELLSSNPNVARIKELINPNAAKNADPQALVEKLTLLDAHLSKRTKPTRADWQLSSLVDELSQRPGDPIGQAYKAVTETCQISR